MKRMNIADYVKNQVPRWPVWINAVLLRINVFGTLVYGRAYAKYAREIEKSTPEQKLLSIVNYAVRHVPYYRKRYAGLKIESIKDFERHIGFIDKDEVMAHWDEFISDEIDWNRCVTGTTGGTSGKPLKLVLPRNRYLHTAVFAREQSGWFGMLDRCRAVIRNHRLPEGRSYQINPLTREYVFDAFRMNEEYAVYVLEVMRRNRIHCLFAYPSAAYQFLKLCCRQGLDVSFIRVCELSSEGLTPEQWQFFEDTLGIKVCTLYGHSEKLIRAGNCPDSRNLLINEQYGYCELVRRDGTVVRMADENGELVGTTFLNRAMPLIRYRTGDYSRYAESVCLKHGTRALTEVLGRWDKNIVFKGDGSQTSITALNLHDDLYEHIDGLQFVQEKKGALRVLIIKGAGFTDETASRFAAFYRDVLGKETSLSIEYVDKLIYQPNGKFLPFISKVI